MSKSWENVEPDPKDGIIKHPQDFEFCLTPDLANFLMAFEV
jgi:hypothetical protein